MTPQREQKSINRIKICQLTVLSQVKKKHQKTNSSKNLLPLKRNSDNLTVFVQWHNA